MKKLFKKLLALVVVLCMLFTSNGIFVLAEGAKNENSGIEETSETYETEEFVEDDEENVGSEDDNVGAKHCEPEEEAEEDFVGDEEDFVGAEEDFVGVEDESVGAEDESVGAKHCEPEEETEEDSVGANACGALEDESADTAEETEETTEEIIETNDESATANDFGAIDDEIKHDIATKSDIDLYSENEINDDEVDIATLSEIEKVEEQNDISDEENISTPSELEIIEVQSVNDKLLGATSFDLYCYLSNTTLYYTTNKPSASEWYKLVYDTSDPQVSIRAFKKSGIYDEITTAVRNNVTTVQFSTQVKVPSDFGVKQLFNFPNMTKINNLDKLDLSEVTSLANLFYNAKSLKTVTLNFKFNPNTTNFNSMFGYCNSLTSVDLSPLKHTTYASYNQMFQDCTSLTSVDIDNFVDAEESGIAGLMFSNCTSLESVTMKNFNPSNKSNEMFYNCSKLTELDLRSFGCNDYLWCCQNMFYGCTNLKTIKATENFNATGNETKIESGYNLSNMFNSCRNIVGGEGTTYKGAGNKYAKIDEGTSSPGYFTDVTVRYNLVYDANGGTGEMAKKEKLASRKKYKLDSNTFTRDNYKFVGWSDDKNAKEAKWVDEYDKFSQKVEETNAGKDIPIYAVWEKMSYTLKYDLNGGTGSSIADVENIESGSDVTISTEKPTKEGLKFIGWSRDKDATKADYKPGSTMNITIEEGTTEVTLYAVYSDGVSLTIIVDATKADYIGETEYDDENVEKFKNEKAAIKDKITLKPTWKLDGFKDDNDNYYQSNLSDFTWTGEETVTLTAKFSRIIKVLTYEIDKNKASYEETVKLEYNTEDVPNIINPTFTRKIGYKFINWLKKNTEETVDPTSWDGVNDLIVAANFETLKKLYLTMMVLMQI